MRGKLTYIFHTFHTCSVLGDNIDLIFFIWSIKVHLWHPLLRFQTFFNQFLSLIVLACPKPFLLFFILVKSFNLSNNYKTQIIIVIAYTTEFLSEIDKINRNTANTLYEKSRPIHRKSIRCLLKPFSLHWRFAPYICQQSAS